MEATAIVSAVNSATAHGHYALVADYPDFLIIDKFPGANLHRNQLGRSLMDQLAEDFPGQRLLLVHRLDDPTSGLLLLAKHADAAAELAELFRLRQIEKFYLAIAHGKPKKKQGLVVGGIEKSRGGSYKLTRSEQNETRTRFFSTSIGGGLRLYLLRPETGKTHQLRVVLSSLGVPIYGDGRYGGGEADRCYLHAWALRFYFRGEEYCFQQAPTIGNLFQAPELVSVLGKWHKPWCLPWPGQSARL